MSAKDISRKYYKFGLGLLISFILIEAVLIIFFDSFLVALSGIVLLPLILRIILAFYIKKNVLSILFDDLNPSLFKEVIYTPPSKPIPLYKLFAFMALGDYDKAIGICETQIQSNLPMNQKALYFSILARAYFEQNNIQQLKITCDRFYQVVVNLKDKEKILKENWIMCVYQHFSNKEYSECLKIIENNKNENNSKTNNLGVANSYFTLAVIYNCLNEEDKANELFNKLISFAPNIYAAKIAKDYLEHR